MSGIGWEFYGLKFSWFVTMLVSLLMFLGVWYGSRGSGSFTRTDTMAGDEGEDW